MVNALSVLVSSSQSPVSRCYFTIASGSGSRSRVCFIIFMVHGSCIIALIYHTDVVMLHNFNVFRFVLFCFDPLGVFKDIVEWCLVVTTPEEAIICALARETMQQSGDNYQQTFASGSDSHLVLIPTRYEIPTDSVPLLSICGTDDGRIFMGGYDGCLYEMSYEANFATNQKSRFYDDEDFGNGYSQPTGPSLTSTITATGKRAISTLVFGPASPSERSRKCRKVNHSSYAPSVVSAFVPGFVLKASTAVFGSNPTVAGGPIVNLTIDRYRKTMYALTAKGFIHAYDLDTNTKSEKGFGIKANPPKLACSVNMIKSARRYLGSVSHGRMYPPSHSGTDSSLAAISFIGGGSGAQAGVGGMDGSRYILKTADAEDMKNKSQPASRRNASKLGKRAGAEGYLHPISIHVVPSSESKNLTLVAISSGGLRYYLSVLPDGGNNFGSNTLKPGRRFTLCHVRAAPSLAIGNDNDVALDPQMKQGKSMAPGQNRGNAMLRMTKSCYASGVTMFAIDCKKDSMDEHAGDSILALTPDYTEKGVSQNSVPQRQAMLSYSNASTGKGVSEVVTQPMTANKQYAVEASVLPGGHIWELNTKSMSVGESDTLTRLFSRSMTPSTMSQSDKLMPAFLPPSSSRRNARKSNVEEPSTSSLETAASMSKAVVSAGGFTGFLRSIITGKSGVVSRPPRMSQRQRNLYMISSRFGCDKHGFSRSTTKRSRNTNVRQSSRLPSALLDPSPAPLSEMAMQHLMVNSKGKGILALNSGGLHFFSQSHAVDKLQSLLLNSNASNIGRDERVKAFFKSYGFSEGCGMCLSIAINADSNEIIAKRAVQAALSYAKRPSLIRPLQSSGGAAVQSMLPPNQIAGFEGYTFNASSLFDGLLALVSRLLRPIWCKPALVVTEGKILPPRKKGGHAEHLPAKVEFLLNSATLEDVRRPLASLQSLIKEIFARAVTSIPGVHVGDAEMADMTNLNGNSYSASSLITQSVQYQNQARSQRDSRENQPSEKELSMAARQNEERNIHALYRLISRTVQLLTLFDHLGRAHFAPSLPEVEFGYLHGLTFSQLVTLKGAQDRMEAVLTNLFSSSSLLSDQSNASMSSIESDHLCGHLSQQCYLYFSIGSRLTFLGFRHAEAAMSTGSISKQNEHVTKASSYLREASKHWHNISHVTGQLAGVENQVSMGMKQHAYAEYNELAARALENGSPLSRATSALMGVNDVAGAVDVCLTCARNFETDSAVTEDDNMASSELMSGSMLPWERSLYHRHMSEITEDVTSGGVTARDKNASVSKHANEIVRRTCHGLLYYHLDQLLESMSEFPQNSSSVERMISIATSSPDASFIHGLYDYLASSGHVNTLLRIDSASLEMWLQRKDDCHLLWRYYTVHNIHWMAGEVMWKHGVNENEKVPLEERIECLTRATTSYSVSLENLNIDNTLLQNRFSTRNSSGESLSQRYCVTPSRDEVNRILSQLSEQIDVAKLQTRTVSTIVSSVNAKNIDEEQISELRTSLVDISKLYNEFAAPLGLYDICLAILQTCKHDDLSTVTKLWRSILCEELLPCRTKSKIVQGFLTSLQRGSMLEEESVILSNTAVTKEDGDPLMTFEDGQWIVNIKARVITLGKELHGKGTDFVFPLRFVAECLEGLCRAFDESTNSRSDHWPIKVLVESGAPFTSLLDAYDSIFSNKSDNSSPALKLVEMSNIGELINLWVSYANNSAVGTQSGALNTSDAKRMQLRRYSSGILTQIDKYKVELESLVGCNSDDVSRCYNLFNDLEKVLRRGW